MNSLEIIGSTEYIEIAGIKNIPAKIDTGADSSSIWVSHLQVSQDGTLSFCLFDEDSPLYTGKTIKRQNFQVVMVRNSSGYEQIRYRTHLPISIKGHKIKATVTLSDRSNNNFPVLIGRRAISGKFLVDVSKNRPKNTRNKTNIKQIQKHLAENPYEFHRKYIKKLSGGASNLTLKKGV